jgi:translation initiation factor IF-2
MSDIRVKDLASTVNAPVEVLVKQLSDAGIAVSGPDDMVTEAQKMKLLEHIRQGQAAAANSGGKIKLKKKTSVVNVSDSRGKATGGKVVVTKRRKKSFATPQSPVAGEEMASAPQVESRSEILAKQLEAERKAREDAVKQAQEEQEKAAENAQDVEVETADSEEVAVEETVEAEVAENVAEEMLEVAIPEQESVEKAEAAEEPQETVQAETAEKETANEVVEEQPVAEENPAEPKVAETKPAVEEKEPPVIDRAKQHAEAAQRAKNEMAGLLKRRPSRTPPKPKVEASDNKPAQEQSANKKTDAKKDKSFRKPDKGSSDRKELHLDKKEDGGRRKKRSRKQQKAEERKQTVTIQRDTKHGFEKPTAPVVREVEIPETIIVSDLAKALAIQATQVIKTMMGMGVMATINQSIDQDTATLIVEEMGHVAKPVASESDETMIADLVDDTAEYEELPRPPVVTIMGHVDHGKTSLLDYIRNSRVVSGEAGGITQHIGAYHVETDNGVISFLDTPGHAAFTAMRARGAKVTDVVILVVAADDGVMPQTKEAIQHARAAEVPLVVAINKIDKPTADPDKVKNELSQHEVIPEDWGGEDVFVNVSAHTGEGIDDLLDAILLVSEVLELKAPVEAPASGIVVEASVEKGRGAVATVMVQKGTLKQGDIILSGQEYGRVRALVDENGKQVKTAGPSIPVAVLGLSGAPVAGDDLLVVADERKAREIAEKRRDQEKDSRFAAQQAAKLDAMFSKMKDGERLQVPVLLKTDVQGSSEALRDSLLRLSTDEVEVKIISSGVGGINESDANLAVAAGAVVVGFNVRADSAARRITSEAGIEIRYYSIIYEVIDDVRKAMSGLLAPELREVFIGLAEVKDVFRSSSFGAVAGCLIVEGSVKRGNPIRVLRDNVVVYEGELESLRRHKDDVNEVISGTECGIAVKDYNDVQPGDQIECFERREVAREI